MTKLYSQVVLYLSVEEPSLYYGPQHPMLTVDLDSGPVVISAMQAKHRLWISSLVSLYFSEEQSVAG